MVESAGLSARNHREMALCVNVIVDVVADTGWKLRLSDVLAMSCVIMYSTSFGDC
jgi:hypothetical protein